MHKHRPSQTAAREPDLARDNFEFEKTFYFYLFNQLEKRKNLNKTAKYL
jgi:hypothetical protein